MSEVHAQERQIEKIVHRRRRHHRQTEQHTKCEKRHFALEHRFDTRVKNHQQTAEQQHETGKFGSKKQHPLREIDLTCKRFMWEPAEKTVVKNAKYQQPAKALEVDDALELIRLQVAFLALEELLFLPGTQDSRHGDQNGCQACHTEYHQGPPVCAACCSVHGIGPPSIKA